MKKIIITLLTFFIFNISFGKPIKHTNFSTRFTGSNSTIVKPNIKLLIKKIITIDSALV
jgi:hypothetical protein